MNRRELHVDESGAPFDDRSNSGTDHLTKELIVRMTEEEWMALHKMAVRNATGSRQGMIRKLIRRAWVAYGNPASQFTSDTKDPK